MADSRRERFVVDALAANVDHCIEWPFAIRKSSGYGAHNKRVAGRKINLDAHRYVCELAHGAPPVVTDEASHSCGNKRCINPRHLYWADHQTNMADAVRHGTLRGGGRYRQRIGAAEIADICSSPLSLLALAERYASDVSYMSRIRRQHGAAFNG